MQIKVNMQAVWIESGGRARVQASGFCLLFHKMRRWNGCPSGKCRKTGLCEKKAGEEVTFATVNAPNNTLI